MDADRIAYLSALCRCVPYHVTEAVLAQARDAAVERVVTDGSMLHFYLVGYTAVCERLSRQGPSGLGQLSKTLDWLFDMLIEKAIFPHRGYLLEFGGDTLNAFFRGPDHAWRAAAAALTAQRLMREDSRRLGLQEAPFMLLRAGLASGELRLPVLGDATRRVVVAAGPAAHRAVALQQLALPGTVLIDQATLDRLGPQGTAAPLRGGGDLGGRAYSLSDLVQWPDKHPVEELGARVHEQVEEKIALLEPFVPAPLAHRLRTARRLTRLDAELRRAIVLWAEITGVDTAEPRITASTNIAASLLRGYTRYGGTVVKAVVTDSGHQILVTFGLHDPAENDAERAVLAALETNARVRSFMADRSVDLVFRSGLHLGRVQYGTVGSNYRYDAAVVGDEVNLAQRIMQAAAPFEVLASEALAREVGARVESSRRPAARISGSAAPLPLVAFHSPSAERARHVQQRRGSRFLVGRQVEVRTLEERVGAAIAGHGSVLGISGPAGVGKSALLSVAIDHWVRAGGRGVIGRCRYATKSIPLAPVTALLYNTFGLTPEDGLDKTRQSIGAVLRELDLREGAQELVALLQPVNRPDGSTETLIDLADSHAQERLLGVILRIMERRIAEGPILYVLEDLQVADTLTLRLIQRVAALARERACLLIGTFRPDPLLDGLRRGLELELPLDALDLADSAEVAARELRAERLAPALAEYLFRRTAGVPLYIVELTRFIAERDLVEVRGGEARVAGLGSAALDELVPHSMAHVIMARLERLGEAERRLLRAAAAIGPRFPTVVLETVASQDYEPAELQGVLGALIEREVLAHDVSQPGYLFRDSLLRDVAYGTLPESERRLVHRRIANALEELPEHPMRNATTLALHRERAGQLRLAAGWYERAIEAAARAALNQETGLLVDSWERCVRQLPPEQLPTPARLARMGLYKLVATARQGLAAATVRQARLLLGASRDALGPAGTLVLDYWLGVALIAMGRLERARERLERVERDADHAALRCDACRALARIADLTSNRSAVRTWLERAAAAAGEDPFRRGRIAIARAELASVLGEPARPQLEALVAEHERDGNLQLVGLARFALAQHDLRSGELATARQSFAQAEGALRALGQWSETARAVAGAAQCLLWAGEPDRALPPLERALSLAREIEDELVATEASLFLGGALALARDPGEGRALLQQALDRAREAGLRELELAGALLLERAAVVLGERDGARALDAQVRKLLARVTAPLYERQLAELAAPLAALAS